MTIEIRQCCNACGLIRVLRFMPADRFQTVSGAGESDGWKEVEENKHMCDRCIKKAIHKKEN